MCEDFYICTYLWRSEVLELQVVVSCLMWALGTELGSSGRVLHGLNCRGICPSLLYYYMHILKIYFISFLFT